MGRHVMTESEDLRAENERLHREIRSLNGQVEGLTRVMLGLHARLDKTLQENAELKAAFEERTS
jgi:hypothetical protein